MTTANVEAGAQRWHKSSYSNGDGGNCVEVARPGEGLWVRDSKRPHGRVFAVSAGAWGAFLTKLARG